MRKIKGIIFVVVLIICLLLGWWRWATLPHAADSPAASEVLTVTPGMNARQVAQELENRGFIRNATVFLILAKQQNLDASLRYGDYMVSQADSPQQIINKLLQASWTGEVRVTIPEGYTTEQIMETISEKGLCSKEALYTAIRAVPLDTAVAIDAPADEHRLDGFLFPDTYFFATQETPEEIINKLLRRFASEYTKEAEERLRSAGLSLREWVILASIVEKEAKKAEDRPVIAGVFLNRLTIHMKLQSCATIQYILGTPKAVLSTKDLEIPSPYNTYLHEGLPPGPIASPGHAALQAVIYPADTDYLYFLAKSDGYHAFAKTYTEHLQNQRQYGGN
ncbi:MAG: endolytic transglycosylase MltG [Peptococcaceae bacterium]|jgi:UPF0755 protein|nr:endolytic transglycosylase MltG [Peptococcaceae bacterium]